MPSKRPSPYAAMDDARLRASPPPSSKRPSRPRPRSGDRRRPVSPNPNPSSRYRAAPPSRKSERKRKPRTFADTDPLALAIAAPASYSVGRAAAGGAHSGGRLGGPGYGGAVQKLWADADEIALLNGAIAFRVRYGEAPRLPDMGAFFDSVRDTLSPTIDQSRVYYKLKRLKSKFSNSAPASTSGPHERRVHDLSADLWGADLPRRAENDARSDDADDEEEEEEDADEGYVGGDAGLQGSAGLPVVSELLGEYWSRNGRTLSKLSLEKGLALLGEEEGREAEAKWRRQIDAELRLQVHRHELTKEVFGLLIDAVKGLGP